VNGEDELRAENERLRARLCEISARLADLEERYAWEFSRAHEMKEVG
jgi:hypothetical protein